MNITTQITGLTIRILIVFLVIILTASLIELSGIFLIGLSRIRTIHERFFKVEHIG